MNLEQVFQKESFKSLIRAAFSNRVARRVSLPFVEKKMWQSLVENNSYRFPRQVQQDKYDITTAILHSIARSFDRGLISKKVLERLFATLLDNVFLSKQRLDATERLGFEPPLFILISPGIHTRPPSWTGIHLTGLSLKRNGCGVRILRLSQAVSHLCGKIMVWTF